MLKRSFSGFISFAAFICCFLGGDVIAQEAAQPIVVDVTTPRRATIVSEKSYTGYLQPWAEVKVFANTPGRIVALHVEVGQSVTKGDALSQSSTREASIAVRKAEVALRVAQSQLTTTEANAQTRVESQLATAQEVVMAAQAQLEETKSLAEMRIRNQLIQAEAAYKAAAAAIERSKINAEQALERAKAELAKADLDFERTKALHEKQHVSESDFESAEKRLKVAQTRHEEAVATASQFEEGMTHQVQQTAWRHGGYVVSPTEGEDRSVLGHGVAQPAVLAVGGNDRAGNTAAGDGHVHGGSGGHVGPGCGCWGDPAPGGHRLGAARLCCDLFRRGDCDLWQPQQWLSAEQRQQQQYQQNQAATDGNQQRQPRPTQSCRPISDTRRTRAPHKRIRPRRRLRIE